MTTQTTKTYWHRHPRNFANECVIVRCDNPAHASILEDAGYDRISRDDLRKHVAWINGENDSFGSNRAFGAIVFADIVTPGRYGYDDYSSDRLVAEIEEAKREAALWEATYA